MIERKIYGLTTSNFVEFFIASKFIIDEEKEKRQYPMSPLPSLGGGGTSKKKKTLSFFLAKTKALNTVFVAGSVKEKSGRKKRKIEEGL